MTPVLITYPGVYQRARRFRGWLLSVRGLCALVRPYTGGWDSLLWCDVRLLERVTGDKKAAG